MEKDFYLGFKLFKIYTRMGPFLQFTIRLSRSFLVDFSTTAIYLYLYLLSTDVVFTLVGFRRMSYTDAASHENTFDKEICNKYVMAVLDQ